MFLFNLFKKKQYQCLDDKPEHIAPHRIDGLVTLRQIQESALSFLHYLRQTSLLCHKQEYRIILENADFFIEHATELEPVIQRFIIIRERLYDILQRRHPHNLQGIHHYTTLVQLDDYINYLRDKQLLREKAREINTALMLAEYQYDDAVQMVKDWQRIGDENNPVYYVNDMPLRKPMASIPEIQEFMRNCQITNDKVIRYFSRNAHQQALETPLHWFSSNLMAHNLITQTRSRRCYMFHQNNHDTALFMQVSEIILIQDTLSDLFCEPPEPIIIVAEQHIDLRHELPQIYAVKFSIKNQQAIDRMTDENLRDRFEHAFHNMFEDTIYFSTDETINNHIIERFADDLKAMQINLPAASDEQRQRLRA